MGNNVSVSLCKTDAECYKTGATDADKAKTCCARSEIIKLDTSKPNHATYLAGVIKESAFTTGTVGETVMECSTDYPTEFGPTNYKDGQTLDTSFLGAAGIIMKSYCDGGETLAIVGKLTAATGIAYMSLY